MMSQLFDPVFGDWYTEKQIGSGTDGKVYSIVRKKEDGSVERSVLKTIRLSTNRSSSINYNSMGQVENDPDRRYYENIIKSITDNIDIIRKADGGKRFVNYLEWEKRETSDGKGWLILIRMERMRSLASLLDDFSFTLEETLKLGISMCKSLMRCRDFNYIYPNLKPENILFDNRGVCKLADFGSFSCLEPSRTSIAFKRTQYYMAPEFINTGRINCTVDTYALGLVLYSLVNRGRLPFVEEYPQDVTINGLDRSKMNRLNGVELPRPIFASDALFEIISKACANKQEERYLSPKQMLSDLKNALANKPFEKAEYDDVYSVSEPQAADDEPQPDEPEQQAAVMEDLSGEEKTTEPQEEPRSVSLKEEISIPDVTPMDYAVTEKPMKKRHMTYDELPTINKKEKKVSNSEVRKLVILAVAVLVVLVLLLVSLSLRNTGLSQQDMVTGTIGQNIILLTGVMINGG